jgi:hypothetical protein
MAAPFKGEEVKNGSNHQPCQLVNSST